MKKNILFKLFAVLAVISVFFIQFTGFSVAEKSNEMYTTQVVKFHISNCGTTPFTYCIDNGSPQSVSVTTFSVNVPLGSHSICVQCGSSCGSQSFNCPGGGVMDVYVTIGGECSCNCNPD